MLKAGKTSSLVRVLHDRDLRGETRTALRMTACFLAYRKSSKSLVNRQYDLPKKVLIDVD